MIVPVIAVVLFLALYPQFVLSRSEDRLVAPRGGGGSDR